MSCRIAALAVLACAGCDVAGPVVDRLPRGPMPPGGYLITCQMPESCEEELALALEITELRPLGAPLSAQEEDAGAEIPLAPEDVDWTERSIVLTSSEPIEIVLTEAPRRGAFIELQGPVTLRLENARRIERLRVASASRESRLVLDHVTIDELTLGDAAQRFAGKLEAKHTGLELASIHVARMELDSVAIVEAIIVADHLISRDVFLEKATLELGTALFAPTELRQVDIRRCERLSFFGSRVLTARIPRCTGALATRFHESEMMGGVLDGDIDADSSELEGVRLGHKARTTLLAWGSTFRRINFCAHADDVKVEPGGVFCSDCDEDAFEDGLCRLSQTGNTTMPLATLGYNYCEALNTADWCVNPQPDRRRPITSED